MSSLIQIAGAGLEYGMLLALGVFGVAFALQIAGFPDLTVDGTFTLGGAVSAAILTNSPSTEFVYLTPLIAFAAGMIAGTITGLIHTQLHLNKLLAGILMMAVLYSVNLRIMGRGNVGLFDVDTIFGQPSSLSGVISDRTYASILVFTVVAVVLVAFFMLMRTRLGGLMRTAGQNRELAANLGQNPNLLVVLGVSMANGCVALSGCLYAQSQQSADIHMGSGTIVWGLAAMVVGQIFLRPPKARNLILATVVGSIVYQSFVAAGLRLGLPASDLKGATAAIVIVTLGLWMRRIGGTSLNAELKI